MFIKKILENIPATMTLFGGLLAALGGFLTIIKEDDEKSKFEHELRLRSEKEMEAQTELVKKSEEIIKLNKEIAEMSKSMGATMTGGDSFCYFQLVEDVPGEGTLIPFLMGENPLYDLQVFIVNMEPHNFIQYPPLQVGNLLPSHMGKTLRVNFNKNSDELRFRISMAARNGLVTEELIWQRGAGGGHNALRIFRNEKQIYEHIDSYYQNNGEEIKW